MYYISKCLDADGNHFWAPLLIAETKRDSYSSFAIGINWVLKF